jgi:hypothetical protein
MPVLDILCTGYQNVLQALHVGSYYRVRPALLVPSNGICKRSQTIDAYLIGRECKAFAARGGDRERSDFADVFDGIGRGHFDFTPCQRKDKDVPHWQRARTCLS